MFADVDLDMVQIGFTDIIYNPEYETDNVSTMWLVDPHQLMKKERGNPKKKNH